MATMRQPLSFDGVRNFLDTLFGDDLHAKIGGSAWRATRSLVAQSRARVFIWSWFRPVPLIFYLRLLIRVRRDFSCVDVAIPRER
jgi:hypothetical protein